MTLENPELLPRAGADCPARRRLTKTKEEETIIINRSGRSTYPEEKSVSRSGATPDLDWYGKEHLPMNASGSDVCSGRRRSKWQARHGFGLGSYESRSRRQDRQSAGRLRRTRERVEPVTKGSSSVVGCIRQPMFFRDLGIEALSRARLPWRLAMTTPSLAGLWCGVRAGLGITVRTALFLPSNPRIVAGSAGLPVLPTIDIKLHCAASLSAAAKEFRDILLEVATRGIGHALVSTRSKRPRTQGRNPA